MFSVKISLKLQFRAELNTSFIVDGKHAESLFWHSAEGLFVSDIITSAACLPQTTFKWKQDEQQGVERHSDLIGKEMLTAGLWCSSTFAGRFASCQRGWLHVSQRTRTQHTTNTSCFWNRCTSDHCTCVTLLVGNEKARVQQEPTRSLTPLNYSCSEMTGNDVKIFCGKDLSVTFLQARLIFHHFSLTETARASRVSNTWNSAVGYMCRWLKQNRLHTKRDRNVFLFCFFRREKC